MQRRISFIVVCFISLFSLKVNAQTSINNDVIKLPVKIVFSTQPASNSPIYANAIINYQTLFASNANVKNFAPQFINGDFYVQHIGFVCKEEWKFEKTTHIPFRFRLGSLENCNFLEGKNNFR